MENRKVETLNWTSRKPAAQLVVQFKLSTLDFPVQDFPVSKFPEQSVLASSEVTLEGSGI